MDTTLIIIIAIVIAVLVLWFIITSNSLKRAVIKIEEADSDIEVALTKRYSVLTKMIDVVKGYAKHEKETLFEVVNLRKGMSLQEKQDANKKMDEQFGRINVLAENYPELKSSENYNTLQKSIVEVEEHLQASRRMYNANVSHYNELISVIPSNIVAKLLGYTKKEFFEASEEEKKDVKIDL